MTSGEHDRQRDDVQRSLLMTAARETHRDVYTMRRPHLVAEGDVGVGQVAGSVRELAGLLVAAGGPAERAWLVLRLRNRLDALDALDGRS